MVFWIFVILTIVIFIAAYVSWKNDNENATVNWILASIIPCAVSLVMLIIIIVSATEAKSVKASYEKRYEVLTYQTEQCMYNNDNEVGKKELMNQVMSWNSDLAYYKTIQRNFMVGIFYPDIYDDFEFIDYTNMK